MSALVPNPWTFLALTLILAGAGAFVTGRTMALTWRSRWKAAAYMVPLAAAVRFLHFALFQEPTGIAQAVLALAILAVYALTGFSLARKEQMRKQYPWLN